MTMVAQKHSSPVIQVTLKQTESKPGPIGAVSDRQTGRRLPKGAVRTPTGPDGQPVPHLSSPRSL